MMGNQSQVNQEAESGLNTENSFDANESVGDPALMLLSITGRMRERSIAMMMMMMMMMWRNRRRRGRRRRRIRGGGGGKERKEEEEDEEGCSTGAMKITLMMMMRAQRGIK